MIDEAECLSRRLRLRTGGPEAAAEHSVLNWVWSSVVVSREGARLASFSPFLPANRQVTWPPLVPVHRQAPPIIMTLQPAPLFYFLQSYHEF